MNRLLTTFVVGLAGIQGVTLGAESRPKLVVGIVVDQLRTDYLEDLHDMFGSGGFRRLMDKGVYLKDVDFLVPGGDSSSASAIIQTGSYPRYNGITGSRVMDPSVKILRSIFQDDKYLGNFTSETYSPSALRVTTLTDELSVDESGKSRIHSIAPDAEQAIILAGHTGSSAFWLNEETGRWSSTTYYNNAPKLLTDANYSNPLASRLDTLKWTPIYPKKDYPYVPFKEISDGFKYTFSRSDKDVYKLYKQTPFINDDITKAATDYITSLNLGHNLQGTDVLNLGYTLSPYPLAGDQDYRYELQDAYLRLDKNLEELFNAIDKKAGKDDVLIYVVSTGYFEEPIIENKDYQLPGGTFSVKRAMSLLNAYLSAKYGNGTYVDHYSNGHIYLSDATIEEKKLNLSEIAAESRDFLERMSGVSDAYTIGDLTSPAIPELEAYRLAIDPKTAGDIILVFNAGWKVVDDSRFPSLEQKNKTTAYRHPAFLMGASFNAKEIDTAVDAGIIAPTVANSLRIRAPNSSSFKPISLK